MEANLLLLYFLVLLSVSDCYIRDPGPRYKSTKGEIWPKPQIQNKSEKYFIVKPQFFEFKTVTNKNCTILSQAINRYQTIISSFKIIQDNLAVTPHTTHKKNWLNDELFLGYLNSADVLLDGECDGSEYPRLGMDENYRVVVSSTQAKVSAKTIWGILRGLESFSQSIYLGSDLISLRINVTNITDYPRFEHRGLLIDTSRHYIPVNILLENLDAMAYNKLNVFHWHIVDDESFPYVSKKFPELSDKGAYMPSLIYSVSDVQRVIEYARVRGIRVIPEFDNPGHTRSWGIAFRELLTECYDSNGDKTGQLGPMNPIKNSTYEFLNNLFQEVSEVFPDEYVHLGGDEVEYECWDSNLELKNFMKENNITNYIMLENYYVKKLVNIVKKHNSRMIVWEEVYQNNLTIPLDAIVQVWLTPFYDMLQDVVLSGRKAILSSCWYLDHLANDGDWQDFYFCEPCIGKCNPNVIGGEACMWSEVVDKNNIISRMWPRTSAVAERLWSDSFSTQDLQEAQMRLEEHTCRLTRRGIRAQPPNGPGFCY